MVDAPTAAPPPRAPLRALLTPVLAGAESALTGSAVEAAPLW